jgi:hypothetical protein
MFDNNCHQRERKENNDELENFVSFICWIKRWIVMRLWPLLTKSSLFNKIRNEIFRNFILI